MYGHKLVYFLALNLSLEHGVDLESGVRAWLDVLGKQIYSLILTIDPIK